ncbi:hypothetical protein JIG36_12020 [Actinoplanes sp. LDG1-06]|uniref:Uncharacterized protein n=1 Tax=Paractinoplanes ovalisporus TaxID=2810368 RepID=A0ABS2A8W4_9ACTN|nr:hypothetical protein [Actinoplanes ovalisporus]MBM2616284.1 hypothetical protein [Actinoplanes ovalisporus]
MRSLVKRAVAVPAIVTAAVVTGFAAPAQASPYPCDYVGSGPNEICIQHINNRTGVNIWFKKVANSAVTVRFSYSTGSWGSYDNGWFTAYAGNTYSFAWNNVNPGNCITGYLHTSGGQTYATRQKCV